MSKITIDRSVVEQALQSMRLGVAMYPNGGTAALTIQAAITALRTALEQPQVEQKPFAVLVRKNSWNHDTWEVGPQGNLDYGRAWADERINVYTHPQPKRNPLTQEQIEAGIWNLGSMDTIERESNTQFARAIERTHGIGGSMNQQPEVLRLADAIERYNAGVHSQAIVEEYSKAAAELRRLHAETVNRQDWYVEWQKWEQTAKKFERQRNELLEALELLVSYTESCEGLLNASPAGQVLKARAAIAKAEGTPND